MAGRVNKRALKFTSILANRGTTFKIPSRVRHIQFDKDPQWPPHIANEVLLTAEYEESRGLTRKQEGLLPLEFRLDQCCWFANSAVITLVATIETLHVRRGNWSARD